MEKMHKLLKSKHIFMSKILTAKEEQAVGVSV